MLSIKDKLSGRLFLPAVGVQTLKMVQIHEFNATGQL